MEKVFRGETVNMRLLLTVMLIVLLKKTDGACSGGKVCVQKCCSDRYYVYGKKLCTSLKDPGMDKDLDQIPVYDDEIQKGSLKDHFGVQPGGFSDAYLKENSLRRPEFSLLVNGSVRVVLNKASTMTADPKYFCLDYRLTDNNTLGPISVWVADSKETHKEHHEENYFLKYSLLISSIFLFLVLVVYGLLPELRNLGGMILMCYVGSLMFAYIFLFVIKSVYLFGLNASSCIAMTLLVCYFFLATFCWMSVMSYDVWWTFRGYAKARPINRRGERFKFNMYCLFAWGIPLVMTILTGVMNSLDRNTLPSSIIVPEIPSKGCFLVDPAQLVYFYVPMLILIICNWLFYLMTAFNIWRLSRGTMVLDSADSSASGTASSRRSNKQRFLVYLKLSALMGLSWILEVISSFTPKLTFWVITDAYNIFIGLMIFVIFVCKKKIFKKLKKRFRDQKLGHQASTSFTTSSRSRNTQESTTHSQSIPLKPQGSISHET